MRDKDSRDQETIAEGIHKANSAKQRILMN